MKLLTPEQMQRRKAKRAKIIAATEYPDCAASKGDRCYKSDRGGKRRNSPHLARVRLYQFGQRVDKVIHDYA